MRFEKKFFQFQFLIVVLKYLFECLFLNEDNMYIIGKDVTHFLLRSFLSTSIHMWYSTYGIERSISTKYKFAPHNTSTI